MDTTTVGIDSVVQIDVGCGIVPGRFVVVDIQDANWIFVREILSDFDDLGELFDVHVDDCIVIA